MHHIRTVSFYYASCTLHSDMIMCFLLWITNPYLSHVKVLMASGIKLTPAIELNPGLDVVLTQNSIKTRMGQDPVGLRDMEGRIPSRSCIASGVADGGHCELYLPFSYY